MQVRRLLIGLAAPGLLQACSVKWDLDQETMDEISATCRLVGSRILRREGRNLIDVHMKDDTDEKYACIRREIDRRNLATWPYYGDLGDDRPPRTHEQQRCVNDLLVKEGLAAVDNMQAVCGVA